MKRISRFISLVLTAALMLALPGAALADDYSGSCGYDATYTFDPTTGVLTISGTGEIDCPSFSTNISLHCTSVVIEEGITALFAAALWDLPYIESVSIPSTLTRIDPAFIDIHFDCVDSITIAEGHPNYCSIDGVVYSADKTKLVRCPTAREEFVIPNHCSTIEFDAFGYCGRMTEIVIPDSVTSIESYAFQHTGLREITVPASVTDFGGEVFFSSEALETVVFEADLEELPGSTFFNCNSLKNVTLPDSLKKIGETNFYCCWNLETITIPAGVTVLAGGLFAGCESLREVTVLGDITAPASGYAIDNGAFGSCPALEKLTFRCPCPDPDTIEAYAFDCPSGVEVYYPSNCPEWAEVKPFDTEDRQFVYIADEPIAIVAGDANGDGVLGASDISVMFSYFMNSGSMSKMGILSCDMNGDGVVNASDASLMAQLVFGGTEAN